MNFLTTKQISELWGITPKRVTVLAGQGRIPGAKQMDGRWFIPENAAKPADPRKRKKDALPDENGQYLFPFPLCVVTSEKQLDGFTTEQKELYRLCQLFEAGHFPEARELAEKLLTSTNRYIRTGALYLLPIICMYLQDFQASNRYSVLFHIICQEEKMHKADIDALLIESDGEMVNFSNFIKAIDAFDLSACSWELLPFIGAYKLLALIMKCQIEDVRLDVSVYEILCQMSEAQGFFYDSIFLHFYLSLYYAFTGKTEPELMHIKKAFQIAFEHNTLFTLSMLTFYNQGTTEQVLNDYPPAKAAYIRELAENYFKARDAYASYRGKKVVLKPLNESDYLLLSYCLKKSSIEQMAKGIGLTRSGVNKRLAGLYSKLGVTSKKELIQTYLTFVLDWGMVSEESKKE